MQADLKQKGFITKSLYVYMVAQASGAHSVVNRGLEHKGTDDHLISKMDRMTKHIESTVMLTRSFLLHGNIEMFCDELKLHSDTIAPAGIVDVIFAYPEEAAAAGLTRDMFPQFAALEGKHVVIPVTM